MTARGNSRRSDVKGRHLALCAGVALCALVSAGSASLAQEQLGDLGAAVDVPSDAQLFLEADTVVYDSETGVVTAEGGTQIDYGGYKLVAKKVVYNQKTKRLVASGDVELQQPDGNKIYADSADITDDFADGFINALRIETPENTRFAARGAVRQNGNVTSFEQGVYTACEACKENPERAPLWQVKARKIVWDQQEKVVRYYGAKFELFGAPIAYLPYFQAADPTVKRKSGFLVPSFESSDELGYGLRVPYFIALGDDKDITVAGTYYTKQGFLGEIEYRQAVSNGYFTLQAAGISQNEPDAFAGQAPFEVDPITGELTSLSPDFLNTDRGMIGTTGRFDLSDRWTFGWDILAQSDQNFSNTYSIENFNQTLHTSEIYLTGLGDRSYFDLRAQRFDYQSDFELDQDIQPEILPGFDYERIEDDVFGGEFEVDVNITNLSRNDSNPGAILLCEPQFIVNGGCDVSADDVLLGNGGIDANRVFPFRDDFFDRNALEGDYTRGSIDSEWRRTITTDQGLLLTPSLGVRADVYRADMSIDGVGFPAEPDFGRAGGVLGGIDVDESGFRGMATAGLEARYPIAIDTANASHIVEPIGQLLLRPDEMEAGNLPNEDAQSLVFNTSNLFSKDKFSGYDRMEGGSRANVGLRYAGIYATGYTVDAMVGQSYAFGGENPYSEVDLALVGFDSGLETDRSDYVGSVALGTPIGLELGVEGRFDDETMEVRRTDVSSTYANSRGSVGVVYSFIGAQEVYGFPADRSQVTTSASLKLTENWTAYGSVGYDVENSTLISRAVGIGYLDECFSLLATYQSTEDSYQINEAQNKVMFTFGLRTIADGELDFDLDN